MDAPQTFDFAALISPIGPDAFFQEYWERRPLLLQQRGSTCYQSLVSIRDLEDFISGPAARYPAIRQADPNEIRNDRHRLATALRRLTENVNPTAVLLRCRFGHILTEQPAERPFFLCMKSFRLPHVMTVSCMSSWHYLTR